MLLSLLLLSQREINQAPQLAMDLSGSIGNLEQYLDGSRRERLKIWKILVFSGRMGWGGVTIISFSKQDNLSTKAS